MSTTFLELSSKLFAARTLTEKRKLTKELSAFLGEERDFSETLIKPMVMGLLGSLSSMDLILSDEFFTLRQRVYTDDDGAARIALGLAFLQDFNNPDLGLDELVLNELYEELCRQNLDLLVNDLSVNLIQVRNGAFSSLL